MPSLADPQAERLRQIHTIPALVKYLAEELGWPVTVDAWEDAIYDWEPEELGLKAEHENAGKSIKSIKQLRPLVSNQPWGVFFVDFDRQQLPIVALRRVLNGLIVKSRTKGSGHQTWHAKDLLFISSFGEGTPNHPREIALAHFTDESTVGDLPTLRVLGWDGADTSLELSHVARELKDKLQWPKSTATATDIEAWRTQWASAFRLKYQQAINDSKSLALALAELAKRIRTRVNAVLSLESERGHLRQLHQAFKDNLIADLTEDGFADMYAQTITYGLFAARASRQSGALVADDAVLMVPSTNPFLRDLLQDFLEAGGRAKGKHKRIDFDELGINDVVQTLRDVPMDAILRAFNSQKPGDDPVIHFYEDFLKAYDKKLRAKRGVFYTPRPVVRFIVRNVDEILKTEFGIEDGLASTITWGEYLRRAACPPAAESEANRAPLALPPHCTRDTPFVQILDPATGTATFLVEVIDHIHNHLKSKWRKEGALTDADFAQRWNVYVPAHLLPRLYGFELMMAPYAIAHMKIGLKLAETGYTFPEGGPRVNVFLTNALEPAHPLQAELEITAPMLAHEANAANKVKEKLAATVVVGNPPYSGESMNKVAWLEEEIRQTYQRVDGLKLVERGKKNWLLDDYVKFTRRAHRQILYSGAGCIGLVINNAFLDNPTFRGLRRSLIDDFEVRRFCNLHGSGKRSDAGDLEDQNVFDIQQGVCVALLAKNPEMISSSTDYVEMFGTRVAKFERLLGADPLLRYGQIPSSAPAHYFVPLADGARAPEYAAGFQVTDMFSVYGNGLISAKDHFAYAPNRAAMADRMHRLLDANVSDELAASQFRIKDNSMWRLSDARSRLRLSFDEQQFGRATYRPFDDAWSYFDHDIIFNQRLPVTRHIFSHKNLCLLTTRMTKGESWSHIFCTRLISDCAALSNATSTNAFVFPLWLWSASNSISNLSKSFRASMLSSINSNDNDNDNDNDLEIEPSVSEINSAGAFSYTYAILHSPAYRTRYGAFLQKDFPRIPIPDSRAVFEELASLGEQLVAWHLLEHEDARSIVFSASTAGVKQSQLNPIPLVGQRTRPMWFGADRTLLKVAQKGRALAELTAVDAAISNPSTSSGRTDQEATDTASALGLETVGKVFINATSGFANVRVGVWKHTIGGYQVLHKWLDDRRKAGRSLSDADITHWLRVYAALEATQGLMQQVDEAIDAHGGWPDGAGNGGAFSLDHPPPDAATIAAEQATVAAQLKAGKKQAKHATTAATSGPAPGGIGGTMSLFDPESDLDELATASARGPVVTGPENAAALLQATEASAPTRRIEEIDDWDMMCAVRAVLARVGALSRDDLIRETAHELGFGRTGSRIADALDDAIRRAVRHSIAINEGGELSLVSRTIEGYDRGFLKQLLVTCIGTAWQDKAELPTHFARMLGFARTGAVIEETVWSLVVSLLRSGEIETEGRADQRRYRRKKG